ncbi:MAG: F0F1 ATP synthase subunit A [Bacillota bacterium]
MQEKLQKLAEIMEHLSPHPVFHLGPIPVSSTVVNTWIMMAVLFTGVFLATRRLGQLPRGSQHLVELVIEFIWSIAHGLLGKHGRHFLFLVGTLFVFILTLNLAWFIPGMKPPTIDYSTTAAFGVSTIVLVQLIHIKEKGIGSYVKHWVAPSPLLAPLNIIEEFVKPVSLSLRLFGNMFGEKMVVTILFLLAPIFVPVPVMLLGVLMGLIQAFVFTLLTTTYLATHLHGH